jgi:hypothetical protein
MYHVSYEMSVQMVTTYVMLIGSDSVFMALKASSSRRPLGASQNVKL